jgi:hypothetical protein
MPDEPSLFELEFQAFVERGGLDETRPVNEDFERTRMARLCVHRLLVKECVLCYKAPKPYMPGGNS